MFDKDDRILEVLRYESMLLKGEVAFFESDDFVNIIDFYIEYGSYNRARQALAHALEQYPTDTEIRLLQVEIFLLEEDTEKAELLLDDISLQFPFNAEIYIQRANLYSKKNKHALAVETLMKAIRLTNDSSIFSYVAMEYLYMEDYAQAKKYFLRYLSYSPDDYYALQNLLHCYDFLGETTEAIHFLTNFLDKNPYCEIAWNSLGKLYASIDQLEKAIKCFNFAIISDDSFTGAYFEKAKVLELLQNYEEAIENYKITLRFGDPSSYAFLRMGKCYEKLEKFDEAEQNYLKAVYEDPQSPKAWMSLIRFYVDINQYEKALKYIPKVMLNNDGEMSYLRDCAEIYKKIGNFSGAVKIYKRLIEMDDFSLETHLSLIDILILAEKKEVLLLCENILEIYPKEYIIYYFLSVAYFMNDDIKMSKKILTTAIGKSSENLAFFKKKYPFFFNDEQINAFVEQLVFKSKTNHNES